MSNNPRQTNMPQTIEEMLDYQRHSNEKRYEIRLKKGHDYATDNWLSNFERVAEYMKLFKVDLTTSHGVALFHLIHKIDRLCNLVYRRGDKPENESLRDTILDMKNYMDLMEECLMKEMLL